ncbi:MAG: ATP phosphoribosyltransferase [Actinobacteria bacterium]|nr:ATP phosphoribosyltransferase [Actinomycetota bacterium]
MSRVAVPSRGRLRGFVSQLLGDAGYPTSILRGGNARTTVGDLELIEMRPRDAAAWLAAGRIHAAFISTDLVLEEGLEALPALPLGGAKSDLVVASRDDDGRSTLSDLAGAVVATHLPSTAGAWFRDAGVDATVVTMGGALEGVCAAGLADAIVDLRETGNSLAQNRLRPLATLTSCEALFVHTDADDLRALRARLHAVLEARRTRYVMLHLDPDRLDDLKGLVSGLVAPTVLPLSNRGDLVAVHFVTDEQSFWEKLPDLEALGATGIVALPPSALQR